MTGGDLVVSMLRAHGVKHVFGLPGDTSMSLYDAFARTEEIDHILVRDERSAAYMADAYARVTHQVGVCEGPSGGGALYILPGVSEADGSRVPLVCLTTDTSLTSEDRGSLTALDQTRVFEAITRYSSRVVVPHKLPETIRHAFRLATGARQGASHIALPENILGGPVSRLSPEDSYASPRHGRFPAYRCLPTHDDLIWARQVLGEAQRPVILCGGGVHLSGAYRELARFAEMTNIPVATSLNGKGTFDEHHRLALGVVGGNGAKRASNQLLSQADLVLVLGSRLNATTTAGQHLIKRARIVQVDSDSQQVGSLVPVEAGLVGDIREVLKAFMELGVPLTGAQEREQWQRHCWRSMREELARLEPAWACESSPFAPAAIVRSLERTLPAASIVVCDAGTPTPYVAAYYRQPTQGRIFIAGRAHGSLGYAIPAAVGAQVGQPDRPVVAVFGDGSLQLSLSELETIQRRGLPLILVCLRNGSFNWIKCLQQVYYEERYWGVDFGHLGDYCAVARAYGMEAVRPETRLDLEQALARALRQRHSLFLDIPTQPMTERTPPVRAWEEDLQKLPGDRVRQSY